MLHQPRELYRPYAARPRLRRYSSAWPPPFSVQYEHSTPASRLHLSSIRIPNHWVQPEVQRRRKQSLRSRRHLSSWAALCLLFMTPQPAFALPGTSHALVPGVSLDSFHQAALATTVINNSTTLAPSPQLPLSLDDAVSTDNELPTTPYSFVTDTDSQQYLVDTGANRIIINDVRLLNNFIPSQGNVKGVGGSPVLTRGQGSHTIRLFSDDGKTNTIVAPNAVYVPTSPFNLIPPQTLVTLLKANGYHVKWFKHDDQRYIFEYAFPSNRHATRTLTIPLDERGMFTFHSSPGYTKFMHNAHVHQSEWSAFLGHIHIIPDDDDSIDTTTNILREMSNMVSTANPREFRTSLIQNDSTPPIPRESAENVGQPQTDTTHAIPFDDMDFPSPPSTPIEVPFAELPNQGELDELDPNILLVQRRQHILASIHERLGHLCFAVIRLMSQAGLLPTWISSTQPPKCPGCAYGKAERKPWRRKGIKNRRHLKVATRPGDVVSIDQLISPTPGFVPTHRGIPTTKRYEGATVFVDHFSDFTYVYLMTTMTAASTVEAKQSFERVAQDHGTRISHYHADNGLFDTKAFKLSIEQASQTLSFCGVNAHHQNGKAERRIKDITQGARTALLHAAHRWPKAINPALWPAALKNYVNLRNSLPTKFTPGTKQGRMVVAARFDQSPLSQFSGTEIDVNLDHFHPFGCPVYVLEDSLQSKHSHNMWSD